ncbi:MAG: glycoside hydrolase family 15 protein [Alphaproteobacteria bacterium]|nr:glycoside hydrolase family 15 protein [Alphaproteobacteria bacterium]
MEDYGLIGDCRSAALVHRSGSLDWLCWPRFDSPSCFCRLLGNEDHGRWLLAPAGEVRRSARRYRGDTMILETIFETDAGAAALIDFMPAATEPPSVLRIVEGRRGTVDMQMRTTLRFDYGMAVPWVSKLADGGGIVAIAGPNLVVLRAAVPLRGEGFSTVADFAVHEGERLPFILSYGASHRPPPDRVDPDQALSATEQFWREWARQCSYDGSNREAVLRSLVTLKALTFTETGGIVASPTTSLPERIGATRNWDYRYCWMRDATLTLIALVGAGFHQEAEDWRDWLHRAVAGTPDALQIMYGIAGERELREWEVDWLPGFRNSRPVRVGNAASTQSQLDVFGEVADALHLARKAGIGATDIGWDVQCAAVEHLEKIWQEPDDGIWEVRGGRRHFTHSKIMAWVAFDRSIHDAQLYSLPAPVERWKAVRAEVHRVTCERGFDKKKNAFVQSFGSDELDASLLLIASTGFLPIEDSRVRGTIAAIERELVVEGFVRRYRTESGADGLPPGEGVFLACSFWLADVYLRQGRTKEAHALIDRLLALRNDLGLLSEEYAPNGRCLVGNFPQAFSHLSLVNTILSAHGELPTRDQLATAP